MSIASNFSMTFDLFQLRSLRSLLNSLYCDVDVDLLVDHSFVNAEYLLNHAHFLTSYLLNSTRTCKGLPWPWSYGSWIYSYLWNQCLPPLMLWAQILIRARCTTFYGEVCQWLATGWWFSLGPPVSSTNKTDCHDITEILLKVVLNTIKPTNQPVPVFWYFSYTFTKTCVLQNFVLVNNLWDRMLYTCLYGLISLCTSCLILYFFQIWFICLFNKRKKWQKTSFCHAYNILVLAGHVLCPSASLREIDVSCNIALIVLWGS